MKQCFKCLETKKLGEFYKHPRMSDGRVNKCKSCNKADVKKNREDNSDYYKSYEKSRANLPHRIAGRLKFAQSEAGRACARAARKAWEDNNLIKKSASTMVGNAVRDGKLIKPSTCESCSDKPSRLHGHHDDYAYPLVVRWLCPTCHSRWHKENGEGLNG